MRRGIGRLRAGGSSSSFSPSQISFTSGLWLDPSDISTGYQDSAGTTPQTASGQPTGKRLDKSGNGLHVLQATGTSRPEYDLISGIASDFFDGSNDSYSTAAFAAGTLVNGMDAFVAIKRTGTAGGIVAGASSGFFGCWTSGSGVAADSASGTISYLVNGSAIGNTRGALYTALTADTWVILECRGLNLSGYTSFVVGAQAGLNANEDIGGFILCPTQSTTNRNNIRTWLGAKVGLSL